MGIILFTGSCDGAVVRGGDGKSKHDVDPPTSPQTMAAQIAAFTEWRQVRGERFAELKTITQPTLVVNGSRDVMIPTINSFTLSQHIPNAQLIVYPHSGHASHFQYPDLFLGPFVHIDGRILKSCSGIY